MTCRRCARSAPRLAAHKPLLTEACRGTAAGRAAAAHSGNCNYLWHVFALCKKAMVEKGGILTTRSFIPDNHVDQERLDELVDDGRGFTTDPHPPSAAPSTVEETAETLGDPSTPLSHPPLVDHPPDLSPDPAQDTGMDTGTQDTVPAPHVPTRPALAAARRRRSRADNIQDDLPPLAPLADGQRATRRRTSTDSVLSIHIPIHYSGARGRPRPEGEPLEPPTRRRRQGNATDPATHNVVITGPIAWCTRCARYAHQRTGRGLTSTCDPLRGGATQRRLALLAQGRHPITGLALT